MSDAISTDHGFDSATDVAVERLGVNPGDAFGAAPVERVVARAYGDVVFGDDGDDLGSGSGSFSFGPDAGIGGDDRYERNLDGSIKRNKDGSPRRKRGRPKGYSASGTRSTTQSKSADVLSESAITSVIIMLAGTAAAITKHDHWATDEAEAKPLGAATAEFMNYYDIPLSPKQLAAMNFAFAAGMFCVPRFVLSAQRVSAEKAAKAKDTRKQNVPAKTQTPQPSANSVEVPLPQNVPPVMRNPGFEG